MATKQSIADYIADQISAAGNIRTRKMFGEYALYCDDKVVAFICDDKLFVKPTDAGREYIDTVFEAEAYPGSKLYFLIDEHLWEDRSWLTGLIRITTSAVSPKKKSKKNSGAPDRN